jgi:hypothetical protein
MPSYYIPPSSNTTLTSRGLVPTTIQTGTNQGAVNPGGSTGTNCCCPSSTNFLATLTDKLYLMAQSLKEQFAYLESHSTSTQQMAKGVIIAEIAVKARVDVKWEYVIYIQMYGPPVKGQFDPVYLDQIRDGIEDGTIKVPG